MRSMRLFVLLASSSLLLSKECFSQNELDLKNVIPSFSQGPLKIAVGDWNSSRLLGEVLSIVASEFLRFDVDITVRASTLDLVDALKGCNTHIAIELWQGYPEEIKELKLYPACRGTEIGTVYDGVQGIFSSLGNANLDQFATPDNPMMMLDSFNRKEVTDYLGSFANAQKKIQQNETLREILREECDIEVKPSSIFDPFECHLQNYDTCMEIMLPNPKWSINVYQAIIVNTKILAYITWWDQPSENCGLKVYTKLINELISQNHPTFYYWWRPDGALPTNHMIYVRPSREECYENIVTDKTDGSGSRDCLEIRSKLFNMGNPELFEEEYKQFFHFMTIFEATSIMMDELMDIHEVEMDIHSSACVYLKSNADSAEEIFNIVRSLEAPEAKKSLNVVIVTIFASLGIMWMLGCIWVGKKLGFFELFHDLLHDDMMMQTVIVIWMILTHLLMTINLILILDMNAEEWYEYVMFILYGFNTLLFLWKIYVYTNYFLFRCKHAVLATSERSSAFKESLIDLTNNELLLNNFDNAFTPNNIAFTKGLLTVNIDIFLCRSFDTMFGCIPMSFMNMYAVFWYPRALKALFFSIAVIKVFETGFNLRFIDKYLTAVVEQKILKMNINKYSTGSEDGSERGNSYAD